jgi:hypothetical protein
MILLWKIVAVADLGAKKWTALAVAEKSRKK